MFGVSWFFSSYNYVLLELQLISAVAIMTFAGVKTCLKKYGTFNLEEKLTKLDPFEIHDDVYNHWSFPGPLLLI